MLIQHGYYFYKKQISISRSKWFNLTKSNKYGKRYYWDIKISISNYKWFSQ
jgi:hypothetical protein